MASKSSQINAIWSLKTVPLSICLKTSRAGAQCSYRNGTDLPGFGLRVQSQFSEAQAAALRNLGPTTYLIVSLFPSSLPRGRDFGGSGDLVRAAWRRGRPTGMTRASSVDLRKRVAAAVEGGASCRQAAARFGVRSSGAIRRYARVETGRGQSQAAGRRSPVRADRGACRSHPGCAGEKVGHHAGRPAGRACRARDRRQHHARRLRQPLRRRRRL